MGRDALNKTRITLKGEYFTQLVKDDFFTALEDGFYYFWPPAEKFKGAFPSYALREIAEVLDWVNEPWRADMEQSFEDLKTIDSMCDLDKQTLTGVYKPFGAHATVIYEFLWGSGLMHRHSDKLTEKGERIKKRLVDD